MSAHKSDKRKQGGAVLIMFAVMIFLLLGFIAAGVEAGRWFLVRAELAKSVDAAALIAARNVSNPNINPSTLALEVANANFPAGSVGTPSSGAGTASFSVAWPAPSRVQVDGSANASSIFAQLLGFGAVPVHGLSVAQKRQVEIMMVLDRSGSMNGTPMTSLKNAARTFVSYFQTTQNDDRMGLISFGTYANVNRAMGNNYVSTMNTQINNMNATGATNPEDALDLANGGSGFTNQAGVDPSARIAQFAIFFSDGRPTAFRSDFLNAGTVYNAVVEDNGNCDNMSGIDNNLYSATNGSQITPNAHPTGDGLVAGSACPAGSTRWLIFDTYPINGYTYPYCTVPNSTVLNTYVCDMAKNLALIHAQELKTAGVAVYCVGYGANINDLDDNFMRQISSLPSMYYKTASTADLQGIFQHIALEIKLRLVQ